MSAGAAPDLLGAIVAGTRRLVEVRQASQPAASLERAVAAGRRPAGDAFTRALTNAAPAGGVRVIAECKRRSPSRGILREAYDPAAHARAYAEAGAVAISVLTEPTFFDGALAHLEAVRAAVELPRRREDFNVSEYQILEAAAAGADAVLLIAAALTHGDLARLHRFAADLGLAGLVEVHTPEELGPALEAGATIVGVNSRDLRTLQVDTSVLERMARALPETVVRIAESGIGSADDLRRLAAAGYHGFLIGERLITREDPGAALRELRAA